jgi:hypothetical protein
MVQKYMERQYKKDKNPELPGKWTGEESPLNYTHLAHF